MQAKLAMEQAIRKKQSMEVNKYDKAPQDMQAQMID